MFSFIFNYSIKKKILQNNFFLKKNFSKTHDAVHVLQESIQVVRKRPRLSDWVPTLAIEVDRASSDVFVHLIARDIKLLCVDKSVSRGIIVLNDALAGFPLPRDPHFELLWVDDFSIDQANLYFDSLGYLSDDISAGKDCIWNNTKMRKNIFDELGTRPIDLIRLDKTRHDVSLIDSYLDQRREACKRELMALFASRESPSGLEFEYLARIILNSTTLSVKASSLPKDTLFPIVDQVALVLKKRHAMIFHSPIESYGFASKCIANAAVEWLKIENSK
jgi:hypothetical protein